MTATILSIFLGIGLAASSGFRVFLPLFALSLASYFDVWVLNESWQWVGGIPALLTLGIATILEIFAYYIPFFDNLLDGIATNGCRRFWKFIITTNVFKVQNFYTSLQYGFNLL